MVEQPWRACGKRVVRIILFMDDAYKRELIPPPIKPSYPCYPCSRRGQGDIVHEVETEPSARPPDRWYSYIDCDDRLHRVSRLVLPRGITLYGGSQWWAISSTVSRWLLSLDKAGLPEQFAAYARRTAIPDETYFATLFMHSPFCRKIIRPSMDRGAPRVMHVEWGEGGGWLKTKE